VSSPDFYDAELRAHQEHFGAAYRIHPGHAVLDIGCGGGLTTREAARAAAPGSVLGIDISPGMVERARHAAAAEGLDNVSHLCGDAQTHRFAPAAFDVAISRFGTMFFSDPHAAFATLASALRPGARLVLLVWQHAEQNEWAQEIAAALGDAAQPPSPGADPFSLGDATATARLLERAGFERVHFADIREPVFYGPGVDQAYEAVRNFQTVTAALATLNGDGAARVLERLRATVTAHYDREHGVTFGSRAWLITARRRAGV
jgi:SAM-dependent methyltransferase